MERELERSLEEKVLLIKTFMADPDRVRLSLDVAPVLIDLKHAVPLGIILDELLSNAVKYACPGDAGELRIRLTQREMMI